MRGVLRALARPETAVLALALVVLVALGIARDRADHPPSAIDTYSTYDTATGGYRAAYELLERVGLRVDRFERRPFFLDRSIATLVYVDPLAADPHQETPTPADIAALEAWVRAGGTLLYVGDDDVAAARGVLHLPRVIGRRTPARAPVIAGSLRAAGVARLSSSARRRFAPNRAEVLVDDGAGALVVTNRYGLGRVTAVVDRTLFANAGIATGDRARLFVALAGRARGVVAFDEMAHGYTTPEHWWTVVPRPFVVAVALGCVALIVAGVGAAIRLGPPLVPPRRDDRSSTEFIDALATLYERKAVARETLHEVAEMTSASLGRALGLAPEASNDAIARALGTGSARAAYDDLLALAANARVSDSDLVRGAALAHGLRKDHVRG